MKKLIKTSEARMQRLFKEGDNEATIYIDQLQANPQMLKQKTLLAITKRETLR